MKIYDVKGLLRALQRGEIKKKDLIAFVYLDTVVFCVERAPDHSPDQILELTTADALAQLLDQVGIRNG